MARDRNRRRKKRGGVRVGLIVAVLIIVGGFAGWNVYYDHLYKSVGPENLRVVSLDVAGQEVFPISADAVLPISVPIVGVITEKPLYCNFDDNEKKWRAASKNDPVRATDFGELGEAPYLLSLQLPESLVCTVTLSRTDGGVETPIDIGDLGDAGGVFDAANSENAAGDAVRAQLLSLRKAGAYTLCVDGTTGDSETGLETFHYKIDFSVRLPDPVFTAGRTQLAQGDILSLRLENIPDGVAPEIETELGAAIFTKGLPENGAGEPPEGFSHWYAAVPVGNNRAAGDYAVTVRAGELTYDTMVTVTKYNFDFQNLIIDTSVPSVAAAISGEAIAQFREKITPLYAQFGDELYWHGLFERPVDLSGGGFISTQFGEIRITNGDQSTRRSHYGMDFAVSKGAPVHAGNAGKVLLAEFLLNTGNTVVIEHGGGLKSFYFHMDSLDTTAGQIVEKGDLIGKVGSTGYSTGPHLHYEMRIGEQAISPSMLFEPDAGLYSAE